MPVFLVVEVVAEVGSAGLEGGTVGLGVRVLEVDMAGMVDLGVGRIMTAVVSVLM